MGKILETARILQTVAALSEQMLAMARAYRWDDLAMLELEERNLIRQLSATIGNCSKITGNHRQLLQTILDNHTAITEIIEPTRDDICTFLSALVGTGKAER